MIDLYKLSRFSLYVASLIFFEGRTGIWTQSFELDKQELTPPIHFSLVILEMESQELFAWASLKHEPPNLSLSSS
jgi:hypothetical protein